MKKVVVFLCILCAQAVSAIEPIYISLGSSCTPAFRLTECNLRSASYPFDWIISHYESLYGALEDDFEGFFKDHVLYGDSTEDRYGLIFHHVWHENLPYADHLDSIDWRSLIPSIEEKLNRRIERFKSVCSIKEKVVFVRFEYIDMDKSLMLRDLISSKYPELSFVLMVVKPSEEFAEPWNLENIRNFSIEHNDTDKWREAFKKVSSEFNVDSEDSIDVFKRPIQNLRNLIPDGVRVN